MNTRKRSLAWHAAAAVLALSAGCGASATKAGGKSTVAANDRSKSLPAETQSGAQHCNGTDARYEVSEYDTSGDETPDVRKVFLRLGEGNLARLVLVCRESDLNADGRKDVVRYYTDEGQALREEADRNFDGTMDEVTYFQEGQILRQEFDTQGDGKVDTKIYFDSGKPLRAERDLKARSTAERWQPDRWEYYEDGRVVRMGTDVDGDGKVDRWDRDSTLRHGPDLGESPAAAGSDSGSGPA
ncbi:MAG: hypothetical protein RLZZ450_2667 [Pseudomonadota bacterium]|jgi:hypothetical protein